MTSGRTGFSRSFPFISTACEWSRNVRRYTLCAICAFSAFCGLVVAIDRIVGMGSFLSSPVIVGNVLYIGSMDGNLYALQ